MDIKRTAQGEQELKKVIKNQLSYKTVLKSDLINFCTENKIDIPKNAKKPEIIDVIMNTINTPATADNLINSMCIGVSHHEYENKFKFNHYVMKKMEKAKFINVVGYYKTVIHQKEVDCPIYDMVQFVYLTQEEVDNWIKENYRPKTDKPKGNTKIFYSLESNRLDMPTKWFDSQEDAEFFLNERVFDYAYTDDKLKRHHISNLDRIKKIKESIQEDMQIFYNMDYVTATVIKPLSIEKRGIFHELGYGMEVSIIKVISNNSVIIGVEFDASDYPDKISRKYSYNDKMYEEISRIPLNCLKYNEEELNTLKSQQLGLATTIKKW